MRTIYLQITSWRRTVSHTPHWSNSIWLYDTSMAPWTSMSFFIVTPGVIWLQRYYVLRITLLQSVWISWQQPQDSCRNTTVINSVWCRVICQINNLSMILQQFLPNQFPRVAWIKSMVWYPHVNPTCVLSIYKSPAGEELLVILHTGVTPFDSMTPAWLLGPPWVSLLLPRESFGSRGIMSWGLRCYSLYEYHGNSPRIAAGTRLS